MPNRQPTIIEMLSVFSQVGYSGLETGSRETTSYVLRQGKATVLLTTALLRTVLKEGHHGSGQGELASILFT